MKNVSLFARLSLLLVLALSLVGLKPASAEHITVTLLGDFTHHSYTGSSLGLNYDTFTIVNDPLSGWYSNYQAPTSSDENSNWDWNPFYEIHFEITLSIQYYYHVGSTYTTTTAYTHFRDYTLVSGLTTGYQNTAWNYGEIDSICPATYFPTDCSPYTISGNLDGCRYSYTYAIKMYGSGHVLIDTVANTQSSTYTLGTFLTGGGGG